MTDASFVERITDPIVIDRRTERAPLEAKTPVQCGPYGPRPDPGPFWRQPLAVGLVGYVLVMISLVFVL